MIYECIVLVIIWEVVLDSIIVIIVDVVFVVVVIGCYCNYFGVSGIIIKMDVFIIVVVCLDDNVVFVVVFFVCGVINGQVGVVWYGCFGIM